MRWSSPRHCMHMNSNRIFLSVISVEFDSFFSSVNSEITIKMSHQQKFDRYMQKCQAPTNNNLSFISLSFLHPNWIEWNSSTVVMKMYQPFIMSPKAHIQYFAFEMNWCKSTKRPKIQLKNGSVVRSEKCSVKTLVWNVFYIVISIVEFLSMWYFFSRLSIWPLTTIILASNMSYELYAIEWNRLLWHWTSQHIFIYPLRIHSLCHHSLATIRIENLIGFHSSYFGITFTEYFHLCSSKSNWQYSDTKEQSQKNN